MKKLFRNGLSVLALSVAIASCSSSDDSNNEGGNGIGDNGKIGGLITKGQTLTLEKNKEYKLDSKLVVEDGGLLVIQEGAKIIGTGGTSAYIAVSQGAKINVQGTSTNPVVMTSAEKTRGSWGGLVILGKAPINLESKTAQSEVADLTYGGDIADDNSGSIKYLRIEYAGANFSSEKEFNGLSMFGVGSGTVIEYVQAHEGSDDGFEWFGGTVSAKYLVSTNNEDDQFDWTQGWSGQNNENWYAKRTEGNRGIEADNNGDNNLATPYSNPKIKNITLLGTVEGKEAQALKLREGTKGHLENVYVDSWSVGADIQHDQTITNVSNGDLLVNGIEFGPNVEVKYKGTKSDKTSVDVSKAIVEKANNGAGNKDKAPEWTKGWTVGLE